MYSKFLSCTRSFYVVENVLFAIPAPKGSAGKIGGGEYVALKKGHRVRKARGKTQGSSIPPATEYQFEVLKFKKPF